MENHNKKILTQMFDIRPILKSGELDFERILRVKKEVNLQNFNADNFFDILPDDTSSQVFQNLISFETSEETAGLMTKQTEQIKEQKQTDEQVKQKKEYNNAHLELKYNESRLNNNDAVFINDFLANMNKNVKRQKKTEKNRKYPATFFYFLIFAIFLISTVPFLSFIVKGQGLKERIKELGVFGYQNILNAKNAAMIFNFKEAESEFKKAKDNFSSAINDLKEYNYFIVPLIKSLPFENKASSSVYLIEALESSSRAGELISRGIKEITDLNLNSLFSSSVNNENNSSIQIILNFASYLESAKKEIEIAENKTNLISPDSLPPEVASQFTLFKETLSKAEKSISEILEPLPIFYKILGKDKPQKYLILFQNPSEIRPTGGFIGSYGILDINNARITNIFIDDIFNIDGQLVAKIVPPLPIQRISTAWSMHDANWFFDFPTSAQKVSSFYEKTGGSTPDGIIALNTKFVEKILEITGAISMPEYGVIVDSKNFSELIQYKIEKDFDKEENRPKKILADLFPKIIEKMAQVEKVKIVELFFSLKDITSTKDVMFFSFDKEIEDLILNHQMGGEVKEIESDYLAIVHSNINGFKTDKVLENKIELISEIQNNGSIINTLKITREHKGGDSQYEWFNKVNTDYLKVYVPKGSELISAEGGTPNDFVLNFDYEKSYFKKDPLVEEIEKNVQIDWQSGTEIFEESGKTVFGNFVFTSPKEKSEVVLKYRLPFKMKANIPYDILIQKQSGLESELSVKFKDNKQGKEKIIFDGDFNKDLRIDYETGIMN